MRGVVGRVGSKFMRIAVGSYTGDGNATQGIAGVGFTPTAVLVKNDSANQAVVIRINTMPALDSKPWGGAGYATTGIRSLDADGFTVGNHARVNTNGNIYRYVAWIDNGDGDFFEAGYQGNNTDNRSISGVGFQPDAVFIFEDSTSPPWLRHKDDSTDISHTMAASSASNLIQAFEADGFQIGNDPGVNQNNADYEYMAMLSDAGVFAQGNFEGDGIDGKAITVGFRPDVVIVKNIDTSSELGPFTTSESGADNSHHFGSNADEANLIQSLTATGFTVGDDASVNNNGDTIIWWAWAIPAVAVGVSDRLLRGAGS